MEMITLWMLLLNFPPDAPASIPGLATKAACEELLARLNDGAWPPKRGVCVSYKASPNLAPEK
jgi:hypothetical protein